MQSTDIPKRYRLAHLFWTWIAFLLIPVGIALIFLITWWVGVIALVLVPLLFSSARKSACEFVIEHALDNEDFYNKAVKSGTLTITDVNNP